jgi:hypothetical protein
MLAYPSLATHTPGPETEMAYTLLSVHPREMNSGHLADHLSFEQPHLPCHLTTMLGYFILATHPPGGEKEMAHTPCNRCIRVISRRAISSDHSSPCSLDLSALSCLKALPRDDRSGNATPVVFIPYVLCPDEQRPRSILDLS